MAQLFKTRPIHFASSAMVLSDGAHISSIHIDSFPFVSWPDGRPCDAVNMYLLDVAPRLTGGSLVTVASELSHITRYCWNQGIPFASLDDSHFHEWSVHLSSEKHPGTPARFVRNANTVRKIISRTIAFLFWYQSRFVLINMQRLIGVANHSPQVIVEQVKNTSPEHRRNGFYYVHPAMPAPVSVEPKRPISLPVIEAIEQTIDKISSLEHQPEKSTRRFRNRHALQLAQLEYLRKRRHFMILMMKRTGMRPSELVEMSLKQHTEILGTKRLLIPTKKRRREQPPIRIFPITLKDATDFQRYIIARNNYLGTLKREGYDVPQSDALCLSEDGRPIKKSSLERDFARLVAAAGFTDVQACFSMFRHRFITYEVIVHLKEFMNQSKKTRQAMTKTDEQSILKRVATKTGHGSGKSLWSYIDLAWEEVDVWGGVDRAIARWHAADRLFEELLELKYELEVQSRSIANKKYIATIVAKLGDILARGKDALD